jgi:hypothetical protein
MQRAMNAGDRAERIATLQDRRQELCNEAGVIVKTVQKREKALLAEIKKLAAPKRLTNLKITWVQDGEEVVIGPTGDLEPGEFLKHVESIPRSVKAKLDGGGLRRLEELKGDLRRLPLEYKRDKKRVEQQIYACDMQIAKLESQLPGVEGTGTVVSSAMQDPG